MLNIRIFAVLAAALLAVIPTLAQTTAAVAQPGAAIVEPPTIGALGVEWRIEGDSNRNASVALAWRRTGETAWHDGLPLLRLHGEAVQSGSFVSLRRAQHVCGEHLWSRSEHVVRNPASSFRSGCGGRHSTRRAHADGAHEARAQTGGGRRHLPCLSARLLRRRNRSRTSTA